MGFPRQKYWRGLPFPSLGNVPNPGAEPTSPTLAGGFFTTEPPRKPRNKSTRHLRHRNTAAVSQMPTQINGLRKSMVLGSGPLMYT